MIRKSSTNIDRSLRYTKHLSKIKSFTLDEELDLFMRWSEHGDVAARNVLVESAMKVAVAMACRYRARYHDFDELLSAGTEGVMHALRKFDPTMRKRFSSYAWHWVRAYVRLVLIQEWSITGGRGILRSNKLYKLIKVRRRIQASVSDRDDVIDQIAAELKTTPDQVRMWVARMDARDSSLDYEFEDGRTLYDTMPSLQSDPEK
jgi:RNA polymerase sigma factor (sigma-70 family)